MGTTFLIGVITTVVISITFVDGGDTLSVDTLELVGSGTSGGAVSLIKVVDTVWFTVTFPCSVNTLVWTGKVSVRAGHGGLSLAPTFKG